MNLSGKGKLDEFKRKHTDAAKQVTLWVAEVEAADWKTPLDVRKRYARATIIGRNIIFDIKGNEYRIWVKVSFQSQAIVVKKTGTHDEYMKWIIE